MTIAPVGPVGGGGGVVGSGASVASGGVVASGGGGAGVPHALARSDTKSTVMSSMVSFDFTFVSSFFSVVVVSALRKTGMLFVSHPLSVENAQHRWKVDRK
jgi:hypothetical protein